ncbi:MAG: helicase-related protein, partial [Candidatus Lokiarchaeota archaeon]
MRVTKSGFYEHPLVKRNAISYRLYQKNIIEKCSHKNSLVVLPTGLGKTIIGILLLVKVLEKYPQGKVIILAPTRPLVSQHAQSCKKMLNLNEEKITFFTGKISPDKRMLLFRDSQIIISTPQVIKNDLERGRYNLTPVCLLIFDEAHRTRGNYAYRFISEEYVASCFDPLILSLTASPGKNYEIIQELCDNLYIENVIFKTYEDKDVSKYVHEIDIFLEFVDLPIKVLELSAIWYNLFEKFLTYFIARELLPPNKPYYSKLDFLGLSRDLTLSIRYENVYKDDLSEDEYLDSLYFTDPKIIDIVKEKDLNIESIFSYCSSCISLLHGKELLETQNYSLFKSFVEKLEQKAAYKILSAKRIINSDHYKFVKAFFTLNPPEELYHPKINALLSIVDEEINSNHNQKIIIFTQYREMAEFLKINLKNHYQDRLVIEKFIGQSSKINDQGFSQDKQIEILRQFREDKINILIATSVAEEGLDIPNVDAIIFYEPVPSEIRLIQRRGRTGRHASGRCYVLITRGTVDVPYHKVAKNKELAMKCVLLDHKQLNLYKTLKRRKINFAQFTGDLIDEQLIQDNKKRKIKEKTCLVNRSIEEIITELDNFANSEEYKAFKQYGVTFYSDLIGLNKSQLRKSLSKLKGINHINKSKQKKRYLNRNLKTLVNLVKIHGLNGKIKLSLLKDLA